MSCRRTSECISIPVSSTQASNPTLPFPGPRGICQNLSNPNYPGPTYRALLLKLDDWADLGIPPPPSNAPDVRDGTLVPLEEARAGFPAIRDVEFPRAINEPELLDFGPRFGPEGGWIDRLLPTPGERYTVQAPKTDRDGMDIAGVLAMQIRVPLGTHTG